MKTKQSRKKKRANPKLKKGKAYELAVADIFKKLHPTAIIDVGTWIDGPDCRRELDICIKILGEERTLHGIIECKDFNPNSTGPVGISYVDELDSKRRDLNLDFAFICSNAGFTYPAIKKAKRVNIGLLSATSDKDKRIRFSIEDYYYSRSLKILNYAFDLETEQKSEEIQHLLSKAVSEDSIDFNGDSVIQWMNLRALMLITQNPIVNGRFKDEYKLPHPLIFNVAGKQCRFISMKYEIQIEGAWYRDKVIISSTAGVYDWINRSIKMVSNPSEQLCYKWEKILFDEWVHIPPLLGETEIDLYNPDVKISTISITPSYPTERAADLTPYVDAADLSLLIPNLNDECQTSKPNFKPVISLAALKDKTIRVHF